MHIKGGVISNSYMETMLLTVCGQTTWLATNILINTPLWEAKISCARDQTYSAVFSVLLSHFGNDKAAKHLVHLNGFL